MRITTRELGLDEWFRYTKTTLHTSSIHSSPSSSSKPFHQLVFDFQAEIKDRGPAISVISSNIAAATSLSSISLVLSSIIGAWIGSSSANLFTGRYIYGSRSPSMVYVKYISLLSCFLMAFACFVQTARYFVHANFLISMPNNDIPVECVVKEVIRGSNFWLAGLRSLYFATNLLLWIFGPIPMFVCSVIMVGVLVNFDRNTTPLHQYKH